MTSLKKECVYCGGKDTLTKDHIPPQSLFSTPRPDNLITVPSCNKCNNNASKDDEYMKIMLSLRHDVYEHPDVKSDWERVYRGLEREESTGLRRTLMNSIRDINAVTPAGIYLGKVETYEVDLSRLERVASRITKGLFFKKKGYRMPDSYTCNSYALDGLQDFEPKSLRAIQKFFSFLSDIDSEVLGNKVFSYRIKFLKDQANFGVASLNFYGSVNFLSIFFDKGYKTTN